MDVDWSGLPQEIVELISKRITIYGDYLRFRCVCRSWNSFVPKTLPHLPTQLPWLMISHNTFFDLSTNKFHSRNLPCLGRICGSSHGWLVILKQTSELTLLNPITCATISLPSLRTYRELVTRVFDNRYNNLHLIKVVLSSSPSLSHDFVACAILHCRNLVFCKKGYDSWVHLRVTENNHTWIEAVYKNGSFFVTSMSGIIAVCDLQGSQAFLQGNISFSNHCDNRYYTVLAGEDMLLVKVRMQSTVDGFEIFKMNCNSLKWEEIQTLGEYSIFIGKNTSHCFSAAGSLWCRPNCIYFTTNLFRERCFCFSIYYLYDLSNHSIKPVSVYPTYLNFPLGYPVWVSPNPR